MKKLISIILILSLFGLLNAGDLIFDGTNEIKTGSLVKGLVGHWSLKTVDEKVGSDLVSGWDFTSNWTEAGASADDANTFTSSTNGGLYKDFGLVTGKSYTITATFSTDANSTGIKIGIGAGDPYVLTSSGTTTFVVGENPQVYFRNVSAGTTDVTTLIIKEIHIADKTPYGNDGINYGGTISSTGTDFNGTSEYVDIGNTSQTVKSVSLWINADDNTSRDIIDFGGGTHSVELDASGDITATGFDTPTIYVDGIENASVSQSAWHLVTITTATGFTVDDLDIGKETSYFDGDIKEVRIYDRVLSTTEITQLYESYRPYFIMSGE